MRITALRQAEAEGAAAESAESAEAGGPLTAESAEGAEAGGALNAESAEGAEGSEGLCGAIGAPLA